MKTNQRQFLIALTVLGISNASFAGGSSNNAQSGTSVPADSTVASENQQMNPNGTLSSPGGPGTHGGATVPTTPDTTNANTAVMPTPSNTTVAPTHPAAKTAPASQMDNENPNRPLLGGKKAKQDPNHPIVKKPRTNPGQNKDTTGGQLGSDKDTGPSSAK